LLIVTSPARLFEKGVRWDSHHTQTIEKNISWLCRHYPVEINKSDVEHLECDSGSGVDRKLPERNGLDVFPG
jgi:hypothetical protein